jgi:hypothetical protein
MHNTIIYNKGYDTQEDAYSKDNKERKKLDFFNLLNPSCGTKFWGLLSL